MIEQDVRDRLLAEPELLLDDRDVMAALIAANDRAMGSNVVDLRGLAMERLESRLDRLEDTHRSVIAAASVSASSECSCFRPSRISFSAVLRTIR